MVKTLLLSVVLTLALGVTVACGGDDPFTEKNLNSYRVFESLRPGEEFHRVLSYKKDPSAQEEGIKYVS